MNDYDLLSLLLHCRFLLVNLGDGDEKDGVEMGQICIIIGGCTLGFGGPGHPFLTKHRV